MKIGKGKKFQISIIPITNLCQSLKLWQRFFYAFLSLQGTKLQYAELSHIVTTILSSRGTRDLHKKLHTVMSQSLSSHLRRSLVPREDKIARFCAFLSISTQGEITVETLQRLAIIGTEFRVWFLLASKWQDCDYIIYRILSNYNVAISLRRRIAVRLYN